MPTDGDPGREALGGDDGGARPAHGPGRWIATLLGGAAAVTGGVGGCLLFLVILFAPLFIFVMIFGPGFLSIFE